MERQTERRGLRAPVAGAQAVHLPLGVSPAAGGACGGACRRGEGPGSSGRWPAPAAPPCTPRPAALPPHLAAGRGARHRHHVADHALQLAHLALQLAQRLGLRVPARRQRRGEALLRRLELRLEHALQALLRRLELALQALLGRLELLPKLIHIAPQIVQHHGGGAGRCRRRAASERHQVRGRQGSGGPRRLGGTRAAGACRVGAVRSRRHAGCTAPAARPPQAPATRLRTPAPSAPRPAAVCRAPTCWQRTPWLAGRRLGRRGVRGLGRGTRAEGTAVSGCCRGAGGAAGCGARWGWCARLELQPEEHRAHAAAAAPCPLLFNPAGQRRRAGHPLRCGPCLPRRHGALGGGGAGRLLASLCPGGPTKPVPPCFPVLQMCIQCQQGFKPRGDGTQTCVPACYPSCYAA